ncbi:maleylpyruvate isomerase family mycothiol-dependent enzyme [Amycolatopsis cihanbeyliensis]
MSKLVRHIARVHSWVRATMADPSGERAAAGTPPEGWADLLDWWAEQRAGLFEGFAAGPEAPAWMPFRLFPPTTASWARRQAHEAAIHRVDAELALGPRANAVSFDPEFAADGIDELLAWLLPSRPDGWNSGEVAGEVLVHAADAGRVWTVRLEPGAAPEVRAGAAVPAGFEAGATIAGTADSVYRAVWGRPSRAVMSGNAALLEPLRAP